METWRNLVRRLTNTETRTNSIRFGWGSWRLIWVRDPSRMTYLPCGWCAIYLTPRLWWAREWNREKE